MAPDEMEHQNLYVEAVFEFEELRTAAGSGEYAIPIFFQHLVVDSPGGLPYLRIRLEATWEKSSTIDGSIDSKISYITCPESVEIEDANRTNASRRDLDKTRVVYVPAVRDPSKQLKNASGTMMYQIMSSINWSEETKRNVAAKIKDLNEQFEGEKGISMFKSSLAKQWKTYDSDDRYSTASLRFNSTDIETSIKKTEVVFEPTETGKECTIDKMSDGLRSLFYISLVDSILDIESQMQREIERNLIELGRIDETPGNDTYDEMQQKLVALADTVKKNIQQGFDKAQWHDTLSLIIVFFNIERIKARFPIYKQGTYFDDLIRKFEDLFFVEYVATCGDWNIAIENFCGNHSIPIMTIHKSKGLEYSAVYFVGLEDSTFWNFRNQPDEDRCTFFVALSRAKESVKFTFCKRRTGLRYPIQQHNAINEFFDLLQGPGIAEVKTIST